MASIIAHKAFELAKNPKALCLFFAEEAVMFLLSQLMNFL
jgi:hypothetical protein